MVDSNRFVVPNIVDHVECDSHCLLPHQFVVRLEQSSTPTRPAVRMRIFDRSESNLRKCRIRDLSMFTPLLSLRDDNILPEV